MSISNPWSPFPPLPNPSVVGFTVLKNIYLGGVLEGFVIGSDSTVYTSWQDTGAPNGWSSWQPLPTVPVSISAPPMSIVAGDTGSQITLFVYGDDENVWASSQSAGNPMGWSPWTNLGCPPSGLGDNVLFASSSYNGQIYVASLFTIGYNDGALWTIFPDSGQSNGWSPWISLGVPGTRIYSLTSYAAGSNSDGRLEVFALDLDLSIWHLWLQPTWVNPSSWQAVRSGGGLDSGWSSWVQLQAAAGGPIPSIGTGSQYGQLGAMITNNDGNGNLELYVIDGSGTLWGLGQRAQVNAPTLPAWTGWLNLGSAPGGFSLLPMALVGGINSDGREEICALGTNGVVWHSWNTIENATGGAPNIGILKPWAPWTLIGTSSFSGIGIGSDQTGRLELFGVSSGQVYQVWEAFPGVDTFIGSAQVGIVLGGGGTMADFQVGALRYLSNHGMQGTIWAGTSMGALNALVLAQGQTNSQDQLEALWLGLRLPSDILLEQPWLAQSPAWIRNIVESFSNGWNFVSVQVPGTVLPYLPALNSVVNNVGNALSVPALIADLEGLTDAIAQTAGDVGTVLSLISTLVGALLPSGGSQQLTDLGNLYDNMAANASIYSPTSSFIEQVFSLVSAGVPSGIAVLIAVTNLDDGQIYYVGGDGTILTLQDGELSPSSIPSTNAPPAVLASMSFPVILPAMTLGNSDFVDGSLRESLPIDAAIAQGANQIYVISGIASVVGAQTPGFYNLSNQTQIGGLIGMHVRAMTITSSAIQQYSLRSLPADGTLIQPSFNLHGPFVIDPGLMSIAMAYGHMRAGEIINLGSNAGPLSSLSDQIAVLRLRIWGLENQAMADLANAANPPVLDPRESESDTLVPTGDSSVIPLIRQAKEALRNLVCQYQTMSGYTDELPSIDFRSSAEIATIVGLPSPFNGTDSQAWWMQWERHQYTPNSNTPWDTFIAGDGTSVGPAQPPSPC